MKQGTYVVTGAGGFVGRALALALRASGNSVIGIARGHYPELERAGIRMVRADLGDSPPGLKTLFSGVEGVFHVAAKVDMWGPYEAFLRANVEGTRAVLRACREAGVQKLIFTSSPSVVAGGQHLEGVDERCPYPGRYLAAYPETKAIAEREVLEANQEGVLHTVSLRPHLIFGPGDNHFVPTLLARAAQGRLVRVGRGENLTDLTFIEDCVRAHLAAMEALDTNPSCRGKAYFITQGEPVNMWAWIDEVMVRNHLKPIARSVPAWLAMVIATGFESVARILPGEWKPLFTRFLVSEMTTSHYFRIDAAGRDLGFFPRYSVREAMDKTFGKLKEAQAEQIPLRSNAR